MLTASAQQPVLQTPHWDPYSPAGNDTSRKYRFLPPSNRQMVAFQHFSSHFDALTCTLTLRTGSRMCVGHSDTHTSIPTERRKGKCEPCQRASVEVNC
ncbi:hypothetical protein TNIN_317431 [Trichonephila inaurata madagascariensis]|uniref:Uncharacterized protein n=1 Tax=Trichonephila inaurata madagascariensis TaxID=2747483 RepID=A0A8X7CJM4_9ARAC|nr:hypothetical protein TNIN_317431 [Trichonephila inaurata madagascariensis]